MKVKRINNWEYLTYFFNDEEIDEKIGGRVVLTTGEEVPYRSEMNTSSYTEQGSRCSTSVQRYLLIATIDFHGLPIDVDLTQLDISKIL